MIKNNHQYDDKETVGTSIIYTLPRTSKRLQNNSTEKIIIPHFQNNSIEKV